MRKLILIFAFLASCDGPESALQPANEEVANSASGMANAVVPDVSAPQSSTAESNAHPCLLQDGDPVDAASVRAIGTEPFWNAKTQGRCVTYSTPEDQAGTRVWTKVESGADGSVWNGALRGKPFRLHVRPMPDCSDGMSDKRYPLEAQLLVDGEERRGCAEPLTTGR